MEITVLAIVIEMGYTRGIRDSGKETTADISAGRGDVVGGRRGVWGDGSWTTTAWDVNLIVSSYCWILERGPTWSSHSPRKPPHSMTFRQSRYVTYATSQDSQLGVARPGGCFHSYAIPLQSTWLLLFRQSQVGSILSFGAGWWSGWLIERFSFQSSLRIEYGNYIRRGISPIVWHVLCRMTSDDVWSGVCSCCWRFEIGTNEFRYYFEFLVSYFLGYLSWRRLSSLPTSRQPHLFMFWTPNDWSIAIRSFAAALVMRGIQLRLTLASSHYWICINLMSEVSKWKVCWLAETNQLIGNKLAETWQLTTVRLSLSTVHFLLTSNLL